MRSLHDVSDAEAVLEDAVEAARGIYEDDSSWWLREQERQQAALDLQRTKERFTYRGESACVRCYARVELHPVLGMCESCCEHEGVR